MDRSSYEIMIGNDFSLINQASKISKVFPNIAIYRIMQIVCGGKASRLHDLLVIHGKTFAIV